MADVNTAEAEAKADAAFGVGFTGTPPTEVAKVVEEAKPEAESKPAPVAAPAPAPKPEKPEYIRVTRQEWDNHKAMFGKVATLEGQIAKVTGSIPKTDALVQQIIEKVRAETPAGLAVEFSKELFAELAEDYPVLAEQLERALNQGKVKGTGAPEKAAAAAEPVDLEKAVETVLTKRADKEAADKRESEAKALIEAFPEWGKIVGRPIDMGTKEPVETDWRKWATTNDPKALSTDSHAEVMASIQKFNDSKTAPSTPSRPDRADTRRAAIADAVTPRFDGSPPPLAQPKSAEDAFGEAFQKQKRH